MQLIEAKIKGQPRNVNTKHGERSVVDAWCQSGETVTIWRPAHDPAVMRLGDGERVQLTIDSKGKVSLVETAYDRAETIRVGNAPVKQPMGFNVASHSEEAVPETTRSAEIADYIQRLGKLYGHCLVTATNMPQASELATPEIKDVATTLFIQTVRHFGL